MLIRDVAVDDKSVIHREFIDIYDMTWQNMYVERNNCETISNIYIWQNHEYDILVTTPAQWSV